MFYLEKPEGAKPSFEAVGCYVEYEENGVVKVLKLLRSPYLKIEPLKWGGPAGKVEEGEDPRSAMVRELLEEAGIKVNAEWLKFVAKYYCDFRPDYQFSFTYHVFRLRLAKLPRIILNSENVAWVWIQPGLAHALQLFKDEQPCINAVYGL